jgi:hypothetical protein
MGVAVFLAAAIAGQQLLRGHLAAVRQVPPTPMQRDLANLPLRLGRWVGRDLPVSEENRYGDEHLHREYRHAETGNTVKVWVAYSKVGADRFHHQEVCMAVSGHLEDRSVRRTLSVPGEGDAIQQYRFQGPGGAQWIFYWHYTLAFDSDSQLDAVQQLYQRLHRRASSITAEVFAPSRSVADAEFAREFIPLLDSELRRCAGPGATRGSERLPVVVDR